MIETRKSGYVDFSARNFVRKALQQRIRDFNRRYQHHRYTLIGGDGRDELLLVDGRENSVYKVSIVDYTGDVLPGTSMFELE